MLQRFPLEIQDLVLQQTHVGALASLARTCSHYLRLAKPILYRHIYIGDHAAFERIRYFRAVNDPALTRTPASVHFDDPTTFQLFRKTLLKRPSHFGPLIVSLEIIVCAGEIGWTDFPALFSKMPNLRRLTINSSCADPSDRDLCALSSVTPKLRVLSSWTIPLRPVFTHFLLSHPNLTVWHHGFNQRWWDLDAAVLSAVLARLTHFETKINRPAESAKLLRGMTNLNHLSIAHDYQDFHTLEAMAKELEAIECFGKGLVGLSWGTLRLTSRSGEKDTLVWMIRNILPRTPALRHLRIEDWFLPESLPLSPTLRSCVPSSIQTLQLSDIPRIGRGPLKAVSLEDAYRAAHVVSEIMPSVVQFAYCQYFFYRSEDGSWVRGDSMAAAQWPLDWATGSGFSPWMFED